MNKRTLQEWVKKFGREKAAYQLGVTSTTVYIWEKRKGFPKVKTLTKLSKLSGLTYSEIISSCEPRK